MRRLRKTLIGIAGAAIVKRTSKETAAASLKHLHQMGLTDRWGTRRAATWRRI